LFGGGSAAAACPPSDGPVCRGGGGSGACFTKPTPTATPVIPTSTSLPPPLPPRFDVKGTGAAHVDVCRGGGGGTAWASTASAVLL
jgi:hypothetical protein